MIQTGRETIKSSLMPFDEISIASQPFLQQNNMKQSYRRNALLFEKIQNKKQDNLVKLFKYINDQSYVLPSVEQSTFIKFLKKIDSKYRIIKLSEKWLIGWNLVVVISILLSLILTPIKIFIITAIKLIDSKNQETSPPLVVISSIVFSVLLIDFFLRCNVSINFKGRQITERSIIIPLYLKFGFWLDLIALIISAITIWPVNEKIVFLNAIFYIDKELMSMLEQLNNIGYAIYRLVRLLVFVFLFTNWAACGFFAIDFHYYQQKGEYFQNGQLWLISILSIPTGNVDIITTFPWYVWFEYSLYWSVQVAATTGYGNITAKNPVQMAYTNVCIIVLVTVFAFYINGVWIIIADLQASSKTYNENWRKLNVMISKTKVTPPLRRKIGDYFHQYWMKDDQGTSSNYSVFMDMLSVQLKDELLMFYRQRVLNIPIFNEFAKNSHTMIKNLVGAIDQFKTGEQQTIYRTNELPNYLYYVIKGAIQLSSEQCPKKLLVTADSNFAQQQFFSRLVRNHSAVSVESSRIARLQFSFFLSALKQIESLYQLFCQARDSILIQKKTTLINYQCWFCSGQHFLKYCPTLQNWRYLLKKTSTFFLATTLQKRKKQDRLFIKSFKRVKNNLNPQINIDKCKQYKHYHSSFNLF